MRVTYRLVLFCVLVAIAIFVGPQEASAYPSYFNNECAGCHYDDSSTCNGCHHHGAVSLSAQADKDTYACGEQVVVTLDGGNKSGWIRGLLFDHNGVEIDRATGPTGSGDDSQPNPVVYPVTLTGTAPTTVGVYVWEAAWWGSPYDTGNYNAFPHGPEVRVQVQIEVVGSTAVEQSTWGRLKMLFD